MPLYSQDTTRILFKNIQISIEKNKSIYSINVKDTSILVYKIDSSSFFYTELFNNKLINFGNLDYYKIKNKGFLLRTGLWKNSECGYYFNLSNAGDEGILEEYCISNDIESIDLKKNRKKRNRIKATRSFN